MKKNLLILLSLGVLVLALSLAAAAASAQTSVTQFGMWRDADETALLNGGERWIIPDVYRTLALDLAALDKVLGQAPLETSGEAGVLLSLPLPYGGYGRFRVLEAPIMEPELAARFPEIKTYIGIGLDDLTATARLSRSPRGLHGLILSNSGSIFIDPYRRGDTTHYISYYSQDYSMPEGKTYLEINPLGDTERIASLVTALGPSATSGDELRTYRAAVAATGEYTIFHGGSVHTGMEAIAITMNRVVGVYEREVAVRMVLVANNHLIVYTNPSTDPYSNNDGGTMLGQNQTNLDAVIGDANYDIGHVFSTGGGGVAYLGVPCVSGWKARGVTGSSAPVGDPFDIDYVAHEMGHQFGANHTFNGNAGSCSGGNRNASTAYEPGSGTTIMAYAGICGSNDLQPHSDDTFHGVSFDEILAYTTLGEGNDCPVITTTGNEPPVVEAGTGGFTIPKSTPFMLTGSATDPDGDPLTYLWEEFDLGPAGHPNSPSGNAPIFRVFTPQSTPTRVFPKMSDIVNNTQTIGEIMAAYGRTLTFRLTARDNHVYPSAGGVGYDTIAFTVSGTAGPFLVTYPNTAVTWEGGEERTITWDAASTNLSPINCASVNIDLSTDGGYTYPLALLGSTPNDGSQAITAPNINTTTARVRVMCATSVFFDISNANFTINQSSAVADISVIKSVEPEGDLSLGAPLTYTIEVSNAGNSEGNVTVTDLFPAGIANPLCNGVPGDLNAQVLVGAGGASTYTCTAEVDAELELGLSLSVDQPVIAYGQLVTYTLEVSNPNPGVTLSGVNVSAPTLANCTPALGSPFELAPGASQEFVCADNLITGDISHQASATASFALVNTAGASAPEDPQGAVTSNMVSNPVGLSAAAEVSVTALQPYYLPISAAQTLNQGARGFGKP